MVIPRIIRRHSQRSLELIASAFMLSGQWVGSTTGRGAALYIVSNVIWWAWMFRGRHWGFIPLNAVTAFICGYNLWSAL